MKSYIILYFGIFIYSLCSVMGKVAASYDIFSQKWLLFYGAGIAMMVVYAIIWQQVLKKMTLAAAYANRAINLFFGILWGIVLFDEQFTISKLIGSCLVFAGVFIMSKE